MPEERDKRPVEYVSKCCSAEVMPRENTEAKPRKFTHFYVCISCGKKCSLHQNPFQ